MENSNISSSNTPWLNYLLGIVMIGLSCYLFYLSYQTGRVVVENPNKTTTVTYNPTQLIGYSVGGIVCLGIAYSSFTLKSLSDVFLSINKLQQDIDSSSKNKTTFSFTS